MSLTNDLAYCGHYDNSHKDFAYNINKSFSLKNTLAYQVGVLNSFIKPVPRVPVANVRQIIDGVFVDRKFEIRTLLEIFAVFSDKNVFRTGPNVIKLFTGVIYECNKPECLHLQGLSDLAYSLRIRPGAYPRMNHPKGASLKLAPALLANIRLGCRNLRMTNTLAYF
jgi:hypothetical protein